MKTLREEVKTDKSRDRFYRKQVIADRKMERAAAKAQKVSARVEKRGQRVLAMSARLNEKSEKRAFRAAAKATRIAAMEAKLQALKNPVGIAAKKAAKKPSKVVTIINPTAALEAAMNRVRFE
jgi:hypothetical protein